MDDFVTSACSTPEYLHFLSRPRVQVLDILTTNTSCAHVIMFIPRQDSKPCPHKVKRPTHANLSTDSAGVIGLLCGSSDAA